MIVLYRLFRGVFGMAVALFEGSFVYAGGVIVCRGMVYVDFGIEGCVFKRI